MLASRLSRETFFLTGLMTMQFSSLTISMGEFASIPHSSANAFGNRTAKLFPHF